MKVVIETPLSLVHESSNIEDLEQSITDIEIENMRQEQSITDHDVAILKLQEAAEQKEDKSNGN